MNFCSFWTDINDSKVLELFAQNAFFRHFGDFQAGYWLDIGLSSTSIVFYDILAQASEEIKILRQENKVTYVFPG